MTGAKLVHAEMLERTLTRRYGGWSEAAGGLFALAVALGLWVMVLAGVAAPLGDALARLHAEPPPASYAACGVPADALASVEPAPAAEACP